MRFRTLFIRIPYHPYIAGKRVKQGGSPVPGSGAGAVLCAPQVAVHERCREGRHR
jgi:hypothetical protein